VRARSSQEVTTNVLVCAFVERVLEFVRNTLVDRELLAEVFCVTLCWLQKTYVRTRAAITWASLSNTSEKPVLLITNISNTTPDFCDFNSARLISLEATRNAVLVEHEGIQFQPNTLVKHKSSSKWSVTSDGAQQFRMAIVSPIWMGLHPVDSDAVPTRHNSAGTVTALYELCDARGATIEIQESKYSVTSFQASKDLEEEVGEPYITNCSEGYVWCCDVFDDALILATTSCVPSGYAAVCRAYTASELRAVLRDLGTLTASVDVPAGSWCVSLVDYSSGSTYSATEPLLADAYGIVLLKVVEGRRHDGTG
jgi:hypothetical protein